MQFARPFIKSDLHYFDKIKVLGFDFIELLVPEPEDDLKAKEVKKAATDAGLFVVLAARVNLQRSIASDDATARQGGFDYLRYAVDFAQAIEAKIVGGPLYGEPLVFAGRAPTPFTDADIERRAAHAIEGLQKAAPYAQQAGVTLALEALNRFETDIVSTTSQAIAMVDAVDNSGIGVMLDTFHMNMEDRSIPDAIRLTGNRLVHFQANENHRGFPGTGNMNWPQIMRALYEVNYKGPISLEPFRRNDERIALPIAHWRAPKTDESEMLEAGIAVIGNALRLAGANQ